MIWPYQYAYWTIRWQTNLWSVKLQTSQLGNKEVVKIMEKLHYVFDTKPKLTAYK